MIPKTTLERLYCKKNQSMMQISKSLGCSPHKVEYWMTFHNIKRRSISEAIYVHNHPKGDPFKVKIAETKEDKFLEGLGLGLYWGEGNKRSRHSIRLGNTDPALLRQFMKFMVNSFGLKKKDFRFQLQVFTDIDPDLALAYWVKELGVKPEQFMKIHITISGSIGTYRHKSEYGVVTVNYHNKKLRDILVEMLPR